MPDPMEADRNNGCLYLFIIGALLLLLGACSNLAGQPELVATLPRSTAGAAAQTPVPQRLDLIVTGFPEVDSEQNNLHAEATAEVTEPAFDAVSFSGVVNHGTDGFDVPEDLTVALRYGNPDDGLTTQQTIIDDENRFSFTDVPYQANSAYLVFAVYKGLSFSSEIVSATGLTESNALDITLYEQTSETDAVTLTNVDFVTEILTVEGLGSGLYITQVNTYQNNTDRYYLVPIEGQQVAVSLVVRVPPGAMLLDNPNASRYRQVQEQFAVVDTFPVLPGEFSNEVVYFLPYEEGATIDLAMTTPFDGTLNAYLVDGILNVEGQGIENLGIETIDTPSGNSVEAVRYQAPISGPAGESIVFDITGSIFTPRNTSDDPNLITDYRLLFAILAVALLVGGGIVVLLLRRGRSDDQKEIDRLLREIAELEDLHDAGQINHDLFQRRRQQLKARISTLMAQRSTNESS